MSTVFEGTDGWIGFGVIFTDFGVVLGTGLAFTGLGVVDVLYKLPPRRVCQRNPAMPNGAGEVVLGRGVVTVLPFTFTGPLVVLIRVNLSPDDVEIVFNSISFLLLVVVTGFQVTRSGVELIIGF